MHLQCGRPGFNPWVEKIPWRRAWQPTPLFLPGESLWREEPGRWQGSQRVGHDWATVPTAQPLGVKTQMWIGVLTKALSIQSQSEFLLLCRQPQDIFVVEGHRDLKTIPSNHHKWNGVVFQKPAKAHQFQVFLFYCVLCLFSAHIKYATTWLTNIWLNILKYKIKLYNKLLLEKLIKSKLVSPFLFYLSFSVSLVSLKCWLAPDLSNFNIYFIIFFNKLMAQTATRSHSKHFLGFPTTS